MGLKIKRFIWFCFDGYGALHYKYIEYTGAGLLITYYYNMKTVGKEGLGWMSPVLHCSIHIIKSHMSSMRLKQAGAVTVLIYGLAKT
ncbi:MAG: hypothetical protein SD837_16595 [Candidatus Electrothrix scaldis]|nr:MAG: hypothetical protein SD837_16595 [Candidatus Electrothrix sp. GW3-3]